MIRWNAMVMVLRAGKHSNVGGHIATYQSAAVLYDVGFDHFFRGRTDTFDGDMIYIGPLRAGDLRPRVRGRPHRSGTDGQLPPRSRPRRPVLISAPAPDAGVLAVPHRVDGAGPVDRCLPARYMRYLEYRGLKEHQGRKVWAFLGDGEMDQPESLAAISLAGRERLDNIVFVVNCNLQRTDGPVRGNAKVIQNWKAPSARPAGT